ncbi:PUA domain containing protein [Ignisphaera aggregans DSM 17230]|uniref:PUA domain containing protein n=1 Tax=Ignisphaera aggregans (strain DSM 17230 / JCM 13409 / AQ1.S1) TaxID=583356 RepID=E0SPT0_IGNAA|nr:PUA domain containing protein [Ignisphaera aggregans DSM 17230]
MMVKCREVNKADIRVLRDLILYQYGTESIKIFDHLDVSRMKMCYSVNTGRLRGIIYDDKILATIRASDFTLVPHLSLGVLLHKVLPYPKWRIVIINEIVEDLLNEGYTVFSRHIIDGDPRIRAYDEILVVDEDDELIAVGRALVDYETMITSIYGGAVQIREKVDKYEKS